MAKRNKIPTCFDKYTTRLEVEVNKIEQLTRADF